MSTILFIIAIPIILILIDQLYNTFVRDFSPDEEKRKQAAQRESGYQDLMQGYVGFLWKIVWGFIKYIVATAVPSLIFLNTDFPWIGYILSVVYFLWVTGIFKEELEKKREYDKTQKKVEKKSQKKRINSHKKDEEEIEISRKINKSGTTTITFSSGSRYTGYLNSNDEYHGKGTFTFSDSVGEYKYVGEFKDGEQHGKGTQTWSESYGEYKYVGDFKNYKFHGKGTFTMSDPDGEYKYVGEFKDGEQHGKGTETIDGEKVVGIWKNGEYVDE